MSHVSNKKKIERGFEATSLSFRHVPVGPNELYANDTLLIYLYSIKNKIIV